MKLYLKIFVVIFFTSCVNAQETGETEITTEDGIEVFQNEKFYLLKKNVNIKSDNFDLNADNVKIYFDKSLYDIIELNADGNVKFNSLNFKMNGSGKFLKFEVKVERLKVKGPNSELISDDIKMFSDGFIEVNNLDGNFSLKGKNSKLINESVLIEADSIEGIFSESTGKKEIEFLNVIDNNIAYVKNNDTEMYAEKINFDKNTSIIELIDSVTIIRNEEKITGDYGTLDTINNSYKIKSKNQTKVRVIIQNNE
tara:strand:+ start:1638 stop:2399 length:762 start_codon:yes stop_codon:yes gene_type:complete